MHLFSKIQLKKFTFNVAESKFDWSGSEWVKKRASKGKCKESCSKILDKYYVVKHNCNTRCDALGQTTIYHLKSCYFKF